MASRRIQEIVDRFVAEIQVASEEEAAEALHDRLRDVLGSTAGLELAPVKRRKTTKGYTVLRPCPIPGCGKVAAPRYQMVCKGHSTLPREEILVARDNATKEGGVWFDLTPGKPWNGLKAALAKSKKAG